jgi:S-adenosyl methyltransferase
MEPGFAPSEIDTSRPHPARMYDYYLGGKDNYVVDREAAAAVLRVLPEARDIARENRAFLQRAVRYLVRDAGIRQIIDIGTGIPTVGNVHEVAQQIDPSVRVAYIDNDPIVHVHASALLTGQGRTSIVLADLRDPRGILDHPKVRELINLDEPAALLLVAARLSPTSVMRWRLVAIWRCHMAQPISTTGRQAKRAQPSMRRRPPRWCCAGTPRSRHCSTAGTLLSLALYRCRCGAPTTARSRPANWRGSGSMAG